MNAIAEVALSSRRSYLLNRGLQKVSIRVHSTRHLSQYPIRTYFCASTTGTGTSPFELKKYTIPTNQFKLSNPGRAKITRQCNSYYTSTLRRTTVKPDDSRHDDGQSSPLLLIQRRNQHSSKKKQDNEKKIEDSTNEPKDGSADDPRFMSKETENQFNALWTQAQSLPNIITITRICSTPIICHFIMTHQYKIALSGCLLAGFSDWLDGYIAKNYNQCTVLGTYLDPFADKLFINCIGVSLGCAGMIPAWCAGLWLGRDVLLVGFAYRAAAIAAKGSGHKVVDPSRTAFKIEPSMISKINTVLQFGTIGASVGLAAMGDAGVFAPINLGLITATPIDAMCYVTCATTVLSGLGYMDGKAMIQSDNKRGPEQ